MAKCLALLVLVSVAGASRLGGPHFDLESPFIIGGADSAKGSWPWQLSLEYYNDDLGEWRHTCGASLLDATHALTAAHCTAGRFPSNPFRVVLGQFDRGVGDYEDIIDVEDVRQHENYTIIGGYPNDIAVLYLVEAAEFNEFVQPGIIPPYGQDWPEEDCVATGWGLLDGDDADVPDRLQEVDIMPLTTDECQERMIVIVGPIVRDSHLCADDHDASGQVGACSGDSGGPLNCVHEGTWYIAGAASWVISTPGATCNTAYPSVYTRVSHFYDWIMESIESK